MGSGGSKKQEVKTDQAILKSAAGTQEDERH